jgi:hypothetical protein
MLTLRLVTDAVTMPNACHALAPPCAWLIHDRAAGAVAV